MGYLGGEVGWKINTHVGEGAKGTTKGTMTKAERAKALVIDYQPHCTASHVGFHRRTARRDASSASMVRSRLPTDVSIPWAIYATRCLLRPEAAMIPDKYASLQLYDLSLVFYAGNNQPGSA